MASNPHSLPHPASQALQGARIQCATSCSPERGHLGTAAVTITNCGALFATQRPCPPAQSASERMKSALIIPPAMRCPCGIIQHLPTVHATSKDACSIRVDEASIGILNAPMDARAKGTITNAQAAETSTTELRNAPSASALPAQLLSRALTPYNADSWRDMLIKFSLSHKHPALFEQLMHGFHVWAPTITQTFTPPNNPSIDVYQDSFDKIVHKEFTKQRYIGPFTQDTLKTLIGPFQISTLNIIPKPGKPRKFCLIQNLSYPNSPRTNEALSINLQVDLALFPCEWGTFYTTCALIHTLP